MGDLLGLFSMPLMFYTRLAKKRGGQRVPPNKATDKEQSA